MPGACFDAFASKRAIDVDLVMVMHRALTQGTRDEDKLAYYGAMQVCYDESDLAPMLDFLRAETVKTWS